MGVSKPASLGLQDLASGSARGDHLLYVPESYGPERPAPLAVVLHGAGGQARDAMALLRPLADATGMLLLAPTSRQYTWDVIVGGYGPDVEAMDGALEETFSRYTLDPTRLAITGFSDGASYALSLGINNGDLFSHVLAFSPGFMAPSARVGAPRFFISHGTRDAVLPIDRCSRRIVPQLERMGYELTYKEFEGGHTVPPEIALEAVDWSSEGD
ncbi:MAG: alpha/beta hydrolase-fold protein [Actinomycetota bacterium]|nr:alpha/beta hydrolase-fold protein [Actinomycetota bacterium]